MVRVNQLSLVPGDAYLTRTTCTSDFLAFSFIIFFSKRSKIPELKVKTILDIVAEDATRYFLVIFTSHFVFILTLNLGRVSENILLLSMMLTGPLFRKGLSFFRARKLPPISLENKNSNHTFSPIQSAASSCMPSPHHIHLIQVTDFLSQLSSRYDLADHALAEESRKFATGQLGPCGPTGDLS